MRFRLPAIVGVLPAFAGQPLKPAAIAGKVAGRFTPAAYASPARAARLGAATGVPSGPGAVFPAYEPRDRMRFQILWEGISHAS